MKKLMTALMLTLLVTAGSASALETRDIVALAAMPLAVAAVSEMTDVPTSDLVNVVMAMNRAAVPAPQFVEIVRYTPVALVHDTMEPRFVTYANTQYQRGIYGDAYAVSLADRLELYGVEEIDVVRPVAYTPTYVVERQYVPTSYVVTPYSTYNQYVYDPYGSSYGRQVDPLALVAMPLAVAAVANIAGIPTNDLISLVASLNQAYVPAPQFVEIVRYSPVVFVDRDPQFVRYVSSQVDRGIVRTALVRTIEDRYRNQYGLRDVRLLRPMPVRTIVEREEYIPRVVVSRLEERGHRFGGPPGQLKKELGYQTGAEVVHGSRPGSSGYSRSGRSVIVDRDRDGDRRERRRAVAADRDSRERRSVRESDVRERDRKPARIEKQRGGSGKAMKQQERKSSGREKARATRSQGKGKGQVSAAREPRGRGRAARVERSPGRHAQSLTSGRSAGPSRISSDRSRGGARAEAGRARRGGAKAVSAAEAKGKGKGKSRRNG